MGRYMRRSERLRQALDIKWIAQSNQYLRLDARLEVMTGGPSRNGAEIWTRTRKAPPHACKSAEWKYPTTI
jgi:hypothetical protein